MGAELLQAYEPLVIWMGLGLLIGARLPRLLPRLLGRLLYWVGVPIQVLALTRRTSFEAALSLSSLVTVGVLGVGLLLAWVLVQRQPIRDERFEGSFLLSAMLGNVGFIGLAVAPALIDPAFQGWLVLYSVTHNLTGTYGLGVVVASRFGASHHHSSLAGSVAHLLTVPSLWAFALGMLLHGVPFPEAIDQGLQSALGVVVAGALLLGGLRLRQIDGLRSLRQALPPALIKVVALPLITGCLLGLAGLSGDSRLALVLQAGMPTALGGLILAEEYDLDRNLIASSIVLTTLGLFLTIPLWLLLFGGRFNPQWLLSF